MATDSFDRANNADISNGGAVPWVEAEMSGGSGSDPNAIRVIDNALRLLSSTNGGTQYSGVGTYTDVGIDDEDHESSLEFVSITAEGYSGPGVRLSTNAGEPDNTTGYAVLYDGTNLQLVKWTADTLASAVFAGDILDTVVQGLIAGDVVTCYAHGTTIRGLLNDVIVLEATDADVATGRPGFVTQSQPNSADRVTNWDDWEGVTSTAPASAASSGSRPMVAVNLGASPSLSI